MPKIKTKRGAAKRFKITAGGKIKMAHCNKNHILNKKDRKRKRHLRQGDFVDKSDLKNLKKVLPYN
jgi:large subunit ribosomal protein L35